jgi:hypothetical protein
MKLVWKGSWKEGEIVVETESPDELIGALEKLESIETVVSISKPTDTSETFPSEVPKISGNLGPSQAVREVLGSPWGRAEPRTMKEIMSVLETNAIYFSKSTLSGVLTNMTKKGELRRPLKKEDQWAYVLST